MVGATPVGSVGGFSLPERYTLRLSRFVNLCFTQFG